MDSVPLIIPLLEKENRGTTRKLSDINQELRLVAHFNKLHVFFVRIHMKILIIAFECLKSNNLNVHAKKKHRLEEEGRSIDPHSDELFFIH